MKIDYILGSLDLPMYGALRYVKETYFLIKDKIDLKAIEYEKRGFKLPPKISYLYNIWFVKKNIRKNSITHFTSQTVAYMLNFFKLKKTIVTCYDLIPYVYLNDEKSFLKKIMVKSWVRGLKKADRILAISEYTKKDVIQRLNYPKEKVFVAYPAVDHSRYKKLKKDNEIAKKYNINSNFFNIVYVGNEDPRMNMELIIQSIAELKKQNKKIRFIKVGTPNSEGRRKVLLKLIKELNLEKEVIFTNYVNEKDVPQLYNLVDVLVYPISYAGFGLPPLEAMACGCPVITSYCASLPEVVGDAAITVGLEDPKELINALLKLIKSPNLRKELSKKGIEQSKKFTWKECAKQTLKCYESLNKNGK